MDFVLFLLTTAVLFLRPQDYLPDLAGFPVYSGMLALTAMAGCAAVVQQLEPDRLLRRPITVCVLGLLPAIVISHLAHGFLWGARSGAIEFLPLAGYFLLLVGVVRSSARLQWFLTSLAGCFAVMVSLSLLDYHGIITLPQESVLVQRRVDDWTGEETVWPRLCGTGQFHDPNDLCLLLLLGMSIGLYRVTGPTSFLPRGLWLGFLGLLGYAFALTQSRGGFLALLVGLAVLCQSRFGIRKALLGLAAGVPVLFILFAGRATSFATDGDAGQDRFQLWSEGLLLFRESPLFGIGQRMFEERVGWVAHNSYLHCYAELGFVGGTLFLGAFVTAIAGLYRLNLATSIDRETQRLRPFLLAGVAAFAVGILSLSRPYVTVTYLVLGLASAYLGLATGSAVSVRLPRFGWQFLARLSLLSTGFLFALHLLVRTAIHRSS